MPSNVGQSSSIYSDLKESLDALTDVLKQQASQNSKILEALLKIATQPAQTLSEGPKPNNLSSTQFLQNIELRQKDNSSQDRFSDFEEFVKQAGFSYEPSVLRQVWAHSQNPKSRLAILAGPPGSGKTQLVSLLAEYFNRDLEIQSHRDEFHLLEPVLPSWFSSENLLGFYSQITQQFHPTKFFNFIKRAEHYYLADIGRYFFACLDEFNLAQPEQYLAKILSVMESASAEMVVCQETEQHAFISNNLKLFATINTDSASKALSPKVLDRSVLIRVTPSKDKVIEFSKNKNSSIAFASKALKNFHDHLDVLYELGVSSGAAFGFRTIDTAINYLESHPYTNIEDAILTDAMLTEAVDEIVSSTFLSKLPGYNRFEGEEDYKKALDRALEKFQKAKLVHSKSIIQKIKSGHPGQSAF